MMMCDDPKPGLAEVKRFVTMNGMAFRLYAVIGPMVNRVPSAARADALIASLEVQSA